LILCSCFNISQKEIEQLLDDGAETTDDIIALTFATAGCGSCRDQLVEFVEGYINDEKNKHIMDECNIPNINEK